MTLNVCGILVSRRLKSPQKLLFSFSILLLLFSPYPSSLQPTVRPLFSFSSAEKIYPTGLQGITFPSLASQQRLSHRKHYDSQRSPTSGEKPKSASFTYPSLFFIAKRLSKGFEKAAQLLLHCEGPGRLRRESMKCPRLCQSACCTVHTTCFNNFLSRQKQCFHILNFGTPMLLEVCVLQKVNSA